MTTSKRLVERKVEIFQKNITKRGSVPETAIKKGSEYPVEPTVVIGIFCFVLIGSFLFQLIRMVTGGGKA